MVLLFSAANRAHEDAVAQFRTTFGTNHKLNSCSSFMYTIEGCTRCVKKLSFCEENIHIKPCVFGENSIQFYLSAVFFTREKEI